MRRTRILPVCGILLATAGCVSASVYGILGEEPDLFTGQVIGYIDTGTIELDNGRGTRCLGQFAYNSFNTGDGVLTCSDGERAVVQFKALSITSGHGVGTSRSGRGVRFVYGMSRDEALAYLGASAGAAGRSRQRAAGTGFYITSRGHLLTSAHVVEGCREVSVTRVGAPAITASRLNVDRQNDLALLLAAATPPAAVARFRGGQPLRPGEPVVAYGFPYAGSLSSGGVVTTGTISALAGLRDDTRYLQMSAPVQPGNSGGPLLDGGGGVVGIVSSALRGSGRNAPQNVNFAVKAEVARTFLAAVGVTPETAPGGRILGATEIAERARAFSVFVQCKV